MVNPFAPVYCVRCKRSVSAEESLCEACRRHDTQAAFSAPAQAEPACDAPRWSPMRRLLFLMFATQFLWLVWAALRSVSLFASVDLIDLTLMAFGIAVIAPFGLVAVDLRQDEDRFTLYGYAASGWQLFWSVEALVRLRQIADPLQHNWPYLLEAVFSGALLVNLWLYRNAERKDGYDF